MIQRIDVVDINQVSHAVVLFLLRFLAQILGSVVLFCAFNRFQFVGYILGTSKKKEEVYMQLSFAAPPAIVAARTL